MTIEEKNQILMLRKNNQSYSEIACALKMERSAIAKFCQRSEAKEEFCTCPVCGAKFKAIPGPTKKRFCSSECKHKWWNAHRLEAKTTFTISCAHCGKLFKSTNKNAKYCSKECYLNERYGK